MVFRVNFFNTFLREKKMLDEWRRSVLVPLYKGKGDIKECGNYPGDQVDKPHYKTVGEGNRSKNKEGGDDRLIWVHVRKEYHRRNLLFKDAVGKVE